MTIKQTTALRNKMYRTLVDECKCWEDVEIQVQGMLRIQVFHSSNEFHGCQLQAVLNVVSSFEKVYDKCISCCCSVENGKVVLNIYC